MKSKDKLEEDNLHVMSDSFWNFLRCNKFLDH